MSFWDRLVEEARSLGELTLEWAILIGVALLVLIVGRWIARLIRRIVTGLLGASILDGVWERSGVNRAMANTDQTPATVVGTVVYAYLMIAVVLVAVRVLRLDTIEVLLQDLLLWIPQLILAAIVVLIAAAAASWTKDLVQPFAESRGLGWLDNLVYIAILVLGVVFALDIVNISFAEEVLQIVIAAFAVAFAIAFGVGGIDTAKLWWREYGTPSSFKNAGGSGGSGGGDQASH